uniref:Histamine receptor H3 n=1 Tax=Scleropages formosus TaxID=113540 RepID=A0A8C9RMV8_SCLFO
GEAYPMGENRRALQYGHFSSSTSVFLAVLMTLLVLATVLGNALVILAFVVEKSLRTQGNFFFLNLAIADFLVGGFCIPVYIPYVLTGEWRLGRGLCKVWLVVDYTLCTASVFNIVLISFDRFISVTRAVSYRCQKGVTRQAVLKMASVWLAAFLLYGPAIVSWEFIAGGSVVPPNECYAEFFFNWYFLMTASTVEFFTPFISVTYFNLSIYINIRKRNLMRAGQPASMSTRDYVLGNTKTEACLLIHDRLHTLLSFQVVCDTMTCSLARCTKMLCKKVCVKLYVSCPSVSWKHGANTYVLQINEK